MEVGGVVHHGTPPVARSFLSKTFERRVRGEAGRVRFCPWRALSSPIFLSGQGRYIAGSSHVLWARACGLSKTGPNFICRIFVWNVLQLCGAATILRKSTASISLEAYHTLPAMFGTSHQGYTAMFHGFQANIEGSLTHARVSYPTSLQSHRMRVSGHVVVTSVMKAIRTVLGDQNWSRCFYFEGWGLG